MSAKTTLALAMVAGAIGIPGLPGLAEQPRRKVRRDSKAELDAAIERAKAIRRYEELHKNCDHPYMGPK